VCERRGEGWIFISYLSVWVWGVLVLLGRGVQRHTYDGCGFQKEMSSVLILPVSMLTVSHPNPTHTTKKIEIPSNPFKTNSFERNRLIVFPRCCLFDRGLQHSKFLRMSFFIIFISILIKTKMNLKEFVRRFLCMLRVSVIPRNPRLSVVPPTHFHISLQG